MSARTRGYRDRNDRGRRRPPPLDLVSGVPHKVSAALDALDEPRLNAFHIRYALRHYADVVSGPRERLSGDNNDWLEFMVPMERSVLEQAMEALPARHASHLWRVVDHLDNQLVAKTMNDYRADQSSPWWARRYRP